MNEITPHNSFERYQSHWGWYFALSIILLILGVIGAIYSATVTAIAMLWVGILLLTAGIFQLIYSFYARNWQIQLIHTVIAILAIILGIYMIVYPLHASVMVTLVIGCFLLITGILRILSAVKLKNHGIWWVILITGIVSFLLGLLILLNWPVSGLWLIGFVISAEVFLSGLAMLLTCVAVKSIGNVSS